MPPVHYLSTNKRKEAAIILKCTEWIMAEMLSVRFIPSVPPAAFGQIGGA